MIITFRLTTFMTRPIDADATIDPMVEMLNAIVTRPTVDFKSDEMGSKNSDIIANGAVEHNIINTAAPPVDHALVTPLLPTSGLFSSASAPFGSAGSGFTSVPSSLGCWPTRGCRA
jgi:hypothetical protein